MKIKLLSIKAGLILCLEFFVLFILFPNISFGQRVDKKDYIIVADSIFSQGKIRGIPTGNNKEIHFARSRKSEYIKYTVLGVTEFMVSERVFVAKEVQVDGKSETVFLERLPQGSPEAVFWKLNGEPKLYFVEKNGELQELGDNYLQVLSDVFDNPDLKPLLDLTNLSDFPLIYLAKTAKKFEKPRTFSKQMTVTPFIGITRKTVGFTIPDSNIPAEFTASSPTLGISGEIFLNFKRNLSLNAGLIWSQFDSQEFLIYEYNQKRFDSDIYLDFSLLQVPISAKYYLDLKPNRMRVFGEIGYSYGIATYEKLGIFQAEHQQNSIVTSSKTFKLGETYTGVIWGIGVEKYLSKHRGIVFGVRNYTLDGSPGESMNGITFQLGYKF